MTDREIEDLIRSSLELLRDRMKAYIQGQFEAYTKTLNSNLTKNDLKLVEMMGKAIKDKLDVIDTRLDALNANVHRVKDGVAEALSDQEAVHNAKRTLTIRHADGTTSEATREGDTVTVKHSDGTKAVAEAN